MVFDLKNYKKLVSKISTLIFFEKSKNKAIIIKFYQKRDFLGVDNIIY